MWARGREGGSEEKPGAVSAVCRRRVRGSPAVPIWSRRSALLGRCLPVCMCLLCVYMFVYVCLCIHTYMGATPCPCLLPLQVFYLMHTRGPQVSPHPVAAWGPCWWQSQGPASPGAVPEAPSPLRHPRGGRDCGQLGWSTTTAFLRTLVTS